VVDKEALEQASSEYFGFLCQFAFQRLLHDHHLLSGAGAIGQQLPQYQVDSISPYENKNNTYSFFIISLSLS
jgi:hypothetical protein